MIELETELELKTETETKTELETETDAEFVRKIKIQRYPSKFKKFVILNSSLLVSFAYQFSLQAGAEAKEDGPMGYSSKKTKAARQKADVSDFEPEGSSLGSLYK